ncbi:hypothetical protein [Aquamicrobium ahrensii]|uniref:Uncharacterized protein n=1 Tax=Aquamicrobium ahrensii TaxID=469551 RepID=A0ABV2KS14_9HYPH
MFQSVIAEARSLIRQCNEIETQADEMAELRSVRSPISYGDNRMPLAEPLPIPSGLG